MLQVLNIKDFPISIICMYNESDKLYYLYEKEYKNGKYHKRLINRYGDFFHALYVAGHIAKIDGMFFEKTIDR